MLVQGKHHLYWATGRLACVYLSLASRANLSLWRKSVYVVRMFLNCSTLRLLREWPCSSSSLWGSLPISSSVLHLDKEKHTKCLLSNLWGSPIQLDPPGFPPIALKISKNYLPFPPQ